MSWQQLVCLFLVTGTADGTLLEVAKIAGVVINGIWDVYQWAGEELTKEDGPGLPFTDRQILASKVRELSNRVQIGQQLARRAEEQIFASLVSIPATFRYELQINDLMQDMLNIERADASYRVYLSAGLRKLNGTTESSIEDHTLFDLLQAITSHHPHSVRSSMDKIHQIIVVSDLRSTPLNRIGLFNMFTRYIQEAEEQACESNMSPQQLLFNLYAILQMSQLKAYTMVQFSWLLLRVYNKGNFTSEANLMKQTYMERMTQQANAVKESMKEAESMFWKCDPRTHEEGKTYTQLTKVLQGFLVNEVDLNNQETCREDCSFYQYTKQYNCYKGNYCQQQPRCSGNVVGCQFFDSDMWVCQAPHGSNRRYDWIEYENGRVLGSKRSCQRPVNKVDSWWRWLFWHCSFCFCYCDDPKDPKSDRYFNLREVVSNKLKNRVVTGIRFVKENRIIHLQIQEGELLPLGGINETTLEWKPVDPYTLHDDGVTVGQDYHMLTWESRYLDLDDLKVPQDSIVTGVKLRRVGSHLNLEVQATLFNFTEGKLLQKGNKSYWISNDKTDVSAESPRSKLILRNPDVPTRSAGPSQLNSKPEQFVEFGSTDLEFDAGQNTVPFLDIQEVAPNPPTPLSGIGLYHKGRKYSGGFVAPRIFTYDFSSHIIDHFPELNEAES